MYPGESTRFGGIALIARVLPSRGDRQAIVSLPGRAGARRLGGEPLAVNVPRTHADPRALPQVLYSPAPISSETGKSVVAGAHRSKTRTYRSRINFGNEFRLSERRNYVTKVRRLHGLTQFLKWQ